MSRIHCDNACYTPAVGQPCTRITSRDVSTRSSAGVEQSGNIQKHVGSDGSRQNILLPCTYLYKAEACEARVQGSCILRSGMSKASELIVEEQRSGTTV